MPRFTYICINKIIVIIKLNIGNLYLINTIDIVTLFAWCSLLINCFSGGCGKNSTHLLIFKIYFYLDNQTFTPYLHKNHASYGPISQARYDLYQFLIYNALLVSRRRLNKERVSVKADNPFDLLLPAAMAESRQRQVSIKQRNIRLRLSIWRLPPVFSSQSHSSSISQQPLAQEQCPSAWQNWLAAFASLWG